VACATWRTNPYKTVSAPQICYSFRVTQQGREPKRAIIFDFDGTIADSFQYVYDFLCREAGRPADEQAAAAMQYRGMSMKAMALKLGIPLWRLPFLYFRGRKVMREHLMDVQPFGGMPELIRALHSSGERMYIVSSNSARNIRNFLKTNELESYFIGEDKLLVYR
jgi:phosphoglycolate phosphatase